MSSSRRKDLVERWTQEEWGNRFDQVRACWRAGIDPSQFDSLLPRHQGRWDLRGVDFDRAMPERVSLPDGSALEVPRARNPNAFEGIKLAGIDLSHARLEAVAFRGCSLENVVLCQANGISINDSGSTFWGCDFSRAKWRGTLGLDRARYKGVCFREADLRGVYCYQGYFEDCDFAEAKLKDVDFNASHFVRCTFKGKLEGVWFRGSYTYPSYTQEYGETEPNPMEDVDFSEAVLWNVSFVGCDLSTVVLPRDGDHVLFRDLPGAVAKAERIVRDEWSGRLRELALDRLQTIGAGSGPMAIVNLAFQAELARARFPDEDGLDAFVDAFLDLLCEVGKRDG